jgi:branched-chain amino acid transport system substrate-binding protein
MGRNGRVAALVAAAVLLATARPARADLTLGAAAPLSGPYAALGEQLKRGALMAVDDINAAGGLRGERIILKIADDACDPRDAVEVATGFVGQGVKAVIGHYCSGASIPAARIYEAANVLEISPASTVPKLTELKLWNVFRTVPRDDAQGGFAGRMLAEKFAAKKIAVIADQAPANQAMAARLREALAAKGLSAVASETFTAGGKDYAALAQKLADAGTEALYYAGAYPEAGLILKALNGLGRTVQLVSDDGLVTDEFWLAAGELGEGALMTFPADPLEIEAAQGVIQRFRDAGYVPDGYTLNAYAAVQAWVAGADATGGTDSRRIAEWLRGGATIDTVLGPLAFDAAGDIANPQFAWFRWSGGKYGPVAPP